MEAINSPYPEDQDPKLLQALALQMARTIRNHSNDSRLIAVVDSLFDTIDIKEVASALKAYNESSEIFAEPIESREDKKFEKLYDLVGSLLQQAEISDCRNDDGVELKTNKAYIDLAFFYEFPGTEIKDE